jgi:type I restriction enzyme S subunit
MRGNWESISFADLITERKDRFDPDAPEIVGLPKIEKIDFSEGKLHLGEYEPTKTQQIIVEPGDFVFSGLNIEKGAAGFNETADRLVVSANYSTCGFNDSRVSLDFFKHYMRSENFQKLLKENLKKDYGFTRPKHLMPLTFLVPSDKEEQERIVSEYEECKETHSKLSAEITNQQSLLAKLKQAILQEAIQGKLTAEWRDAHPDVEPASQLLHRIQAEKARLIAAKKLRPEKPLPKITPAEIPFEIPKGWEWCRLVDLGYVGTGATPATENKAYYENGQVPWITSSATGTPFVRKAETFITEKALAETNCSIYPKHTLLVAMYGQGKTRGQVTELLIDAATNQACAAIVIPDQFLQTNHFTKLVIKENYHRIRELAQGGSQPNLNLSKIKASLVPLPPLAEQAAIVERVEALMTTCRALEAEIEQARTHAAHLLQAVLKEAFA